MVWTVADVPDMTDKTVFITGATAGTGLEAARALAARNCNLVLACIGANKMATIGDELRSLGAAQVEELICDLSDLTSVRACVQSYSKAPIDVLLLNAGIVGSNERTVSAQGHEVVMATNHLGNFLLTGLLLPFVRGRIVAVSSVAHKSVTSVDWEALSGKNPDAIPPQPDVYPQSKLANLLFIEELNRRLMAAGSEVLAVSAHPGFTKTDILVNMPQTVETKVLGLFLDMAAQPAAHGAWPMLMAATDPQATSECYYAPSESLKVDESAVKLDEVTVPEMRFQLQRYVRYFQGLEECTGAPIRNGFKSASVTDENLGAEAWRESEKLVGFKYSF